MLSVYTIRIHLIWLKCTEHYYTHVKFIYTKSALFLFDMSADSEKAYCFKVENKFIVKSGCKKRMWRSLKQILTADRSLPWPNEAVLYYSINAPPTFKPTKKYSDISGLPAPYVDRHSKLYYSNVDEFTTVRSLPMDITAGYLQLRGANIIVG